MKRKKNRVSKELIIIAGDLRGGEGVAIVTFRFYTFR